jgi:Family of unknown function (DUF5362)
MEQFDNVEFETPLSEKTITPPTVFQAAFMGMTSDMRFVGMFTIIYGVICCLTIIGALIGIPVIFAGLRLREAADQFAFFKTTNNPSSMRAGFELQGRYFRILKILIIISLVIFVVYIVLIAIFLSSFLSLFSSSSISS